MFETQRIARAIAGVLDAPLLAFGAGGAGLGLLLWGGFLMHPLFAFEWAQQGLFWAVLGGFILGVALRRVGTSPTLRVPTFVEQRPRWTVFLAGLLALLCVIHYNILLPSHNTSELNPHLQVALLLGGWGACLWALAGGGMPVLRVRVSWQSVLFGLILAFAMFVRLVDLEEGIHRMVDEIHFAQAVGDLWYYPTMPILMPHGGVTKFTWLYPYGQMWTANLTGGASLTGLRLMSVLLGLGQVAGIYALLRLGFDRTIALVGMAILASFPPHLHFSRLGLNNIADPTFAVLAFVFVLLALRHNRQRDYVLAGACLGMTHYFYEGGRAFYTVFMVLWLAWLWLTSHQRRVPYALWYGLAAFVVVALPVYYVWTANDVTLFPRYDATQRNVFLEITARAVDGQTPLGVALEGLRAFFFAYVHFPDGSSFYRSDTGYILPILVPFFLVGLATCAWRIRTAAGGLLLWWVLAVVVANYAVGSYIFAPRFVVGFVALAGVVAVGMVTVTRLLGQIRLFSALAHPALMLMALVAMFGQAVYYLHWHLPEYYYRQFYYEYDHARFGVPVKDYDDMLFRAVALSTPVSVHAIANGVQGQIGYGAFFLYYGRHQPEAFQFQFMYRGEIHRTYFGQLPRHRTHAFFLEPDDKETLAMISEYFVLSEGQFSPHNLPPERQLVLYIADVLDNINR